MANLSRLHSGCGRWAIIPVTAVAMLLPLSARCGPCCGAEKNASCSDARHASANHRHSCCDKRSASRHSVPESNLLCVCLSPQASSDCSCSAQPREPRLAQEQFFSHDSFIAGLHVTALHTANLQDDSASALAATVELASPIPHRILHCSWQI
jgi:hypothetical protein